jgi:hypothetical protein
MHPLYITRHSLCLIYKSEEIAARCIIMRYNVYRVHDPKMGIAGGTRTNRGLSLIAKELLHTLEDRIFRWICKMR